MLEFKKNDPPFSLGVEWELQVVDQQTGHLTPKALTILENIDDPHFVKELFQSTLEINTDICADALAVEENFKQLLPLLEPTKDVFRVRYATTGTHPFSHFMERLVTPTPRYYDMIDRNQWIARRMAVYGLHVHIGTRSGDHCIVLKNFFLRFVPHLIALSASSPFWSGILTGLSSSRLTMYESLPTAGFPYDFQDWQAFESLIQSLIRSKSIQTLKDLWWDMRPSPKYGTLELRICDGPATLAELLGLVAFVHCLAIWHDENEAAWAQTSMHAVKRWVLRENKWRAIRHGMNAEIIISNDGDWKPLKEDLEEWLERLNPIMERLDYQKYLGYLRMILVHGNSADRQARLFEQTKNLIEVIRLNVREFERQAPECWDPAPTTPADA